jgi:hypothetical protein
MKMASESLDFFLLKNRKNILLTGSKMLVTKNFNDFPLKKSDPPSFSVRKTHLLLFLLKSSIFHFVHWHRI